MKGQASEPIPRQAHGGQRGMRHLSEVDVVEADDRDILRYLHSRFMKCTHGTDRRQIVAGQYRRRERMFPEKGPNSGRASINLVVAFQGAVRRQPYLLEGIEKGPPTSHS